MNNKLPSTGSIAIVLMTLAMFAIKWTIYPDISYWIVFTPVLTLMAVFVLTLVFSILISAIIYVFRKNKTGMRKKTLEDAKKEMAEKSKKEAHEELEAWRKAYMKKEQMANIETMKLADEIIRRS